MTKRRALPASWTKPIAPAIRSLAVDIETLSLDESNAATHGPKNREAVRASLERWGQRLPLVVDGSTVIVGNLRLQIARELGWKAVAVVPAPKGEAAAFAVADNRTGQLAEWDDARLAEVLGSLELGDDADLLQAVGFSETELGDLFASVSVDLEDPELGAMLTDPEPAAAPAEPEPEPEPVDDADEPALQPPKEPTTQPGDVIELGRHRLVCGDSLQAETWQVLDGERVDMILTDPPYAIYGSSVGISSEISDDKVLRPFFQQLGRRCRELVKLFGHVYTFCDWRSFATVWEGYRAAELVPRNCIVWDKGGGGLGTCYANTYELVAFHALHPKQKGVASRTKTGQRTVLRPNLQRFPRASGDDRPHNASKPRGLVEELVTNSSDEGETVADLFGGGGSTLVACERLGRRAILAEIEPGWCDVIVDRWERLTGETATRPSREEQSR